MSICSTLSRNTRRYRFKQKVNVIDLGLRFDDVTALGLESFAEAHSDRGSERARRLNLQTNGATEAEIQFLLKRRVELNALTSRQFIDLIERKLTTHGVKKLVPGVKLLSDTYRAHLRAQHVRAYIEDALDEAEQEAEAIAVPATLKEQVETMLRKNPRMRWDEAVATIARRRK